MQEILNDVAKWENDGAALCDRLEAQRDAIVANIERERIDVMTINDRLRSLRSRLGRPTDEPARVDAPQRRIAMTRAQREAVPVEVVSARQPQDVPARTAERCVDVVARAAKMGAGTTVEIIERVRRIAPDMNTRSVGAFLAILRDEGVVTSTPDPAKPSRYIWTPKGV